MKELLMTFGYWLLNAAIVLSGALLAMNAWREKKHLINGLLFLGGGIGWHIIRGVIRYKDGMCVEVEAGSSWLSLADACIPYSAGDIIIAQSGIFAGIFILIALAARVYAGGKS